MTTQRTLWNRPCTWLRTALGLLLLGLLPLAHAKLKGKKADVLAANRVNATDSGFGTATNSMAVVDATGHEEIWPNQSKADVAWELCSWLLRS